MHCSISRRKALSLLAGGTLSAASLGVFGGLPREALAAQAGTAASCSSAATQADSASMGSAEVSRLFAEMAEKGAPGARLRAWLSSPEIQVIKPYRVFDNVWNVGIRWVSAYAMKTSDGWILIDTTHEPFASQWIRNLEAVGVDFKDIRYVLMTHGHFDHVGGAARLKPLAKNARFAMTAPGWEEAFRDAKGPRGFAMLEKPDLVLRDREVVRSGDTEVKVLHTPGHTPGIASYLYDVRDGDKTRRAVTIGGLGLNAIRDAAQLDAYIASMERLASDEFAVTTDMTAHPFSIGLTEMIPEIVAHKPGTAHPLADREAYLGRLKAMADNARRLRAERFGKA